MKRFLIVVRSILLVSIPTVVVLAIFLEMTARLFLPVSDVPLTTFKSGIGNHYLPDQQGRYIKGIDSEINARFRINSAGWNSPYEYGTKTSGDVFSIAVIGDSYVEALQVDYDKSFPYLLEKKLNRTGKCRFEVLSFGHSGANLIQYLNVLKNGVIQYSPDLVVFNVVHNDFQESFEGFARVDNWSVRTAGKGFVPVPPIPSESLRMKQLISRSALIRYLVINLDLANRLAYAYNRINGDRQRYAGNMETTSSLLSDKPVLTGLVRYVLQEANTIALEQGFKVVFVMDANRNAVYKNEDPEASVIHVLNEVLKAETARLGITSVDLTNAFRKVWLDSKQRFEWAVDGHWNDKGHQVVASKLDKLLDANPGFSCS